MGWMRDGWRDGGRPTRQQARYLKSQARGGRGGEAAESSRQTQTSKPQASELASKQSTVSESGGGNESVHAHAHAHANANMRP